MNEHQGEDVPPPALLSGTAAQPESGPPARPGVTFRGILPGLALVGLLEATYFLSGPALRHQLAGAWLLWMLALVAVPLVYLLLTRQPLSVLGYRRERAFGLYMRGVAAGVLWRALGMLGSYYGWWDFLLGSALASGRWWFHVLVTVPFLEETFFRGYLQAGLERRLGPWLAILLQALLFALHPAHVAQGATAFPAIFTFGLLAGVLYWRTRSIWIVYGAHGVANLLPEVIRELSRWVYG